ncbi:MAG: LptA/OstA family protein [Verrucomicrobiota bacterium]
MHSMRLLHFILIASLITTGTFSFGQMTPDAPVKNFRFPRFSEAGFVEWVLQGGEGIYDSDEQIRVNEMNLRVYSGDDRLVQELGLKSPQATIRLQENRAFSERSILIEGTNFTISGTGWKWNGVTKIVEVLDDATVSFDQVITNTLAGGTSRPAAEGSTRIQADSLLLRTTETEYEFVFIGDVKVASGDMTLESGRLVALAETPEGRDTKEVTATPSQIDGLRSFEANEKVVIRQLDRVARAESAIFDPKSGDVDLAGQPVIEASGAYISGHEIKSRSGELHIKGSKEMGRAQVILSQVGGLGILGSDSLSSETIVLADAIALKDSTAGNEFDFDGSVEVLSGPLKMNSDKLRIEAQRLESLQAGAAASNDLKVGSVDKVVAEGSVEIERDGQFASADRVIFHPSTERAELIGDPVVENGEARIEGHLMELQPKGARVDGSPEQPVVVTLPVMPDLGYNPMAENDALSKLASLGSEDAESDLEEIESVESDEVEVASETVIHSDELAMSENENGMFFRFSENVSIIGTNLEATCDLLEVTAERTEGSGINAMQVGKIDAIDNVRFVQSGRTATAKKAMVRPLEGKVVLEGDAEVVDDRGTVTGHRIILNRGQRQASVEGDGTNQQRAKITLPALPSKAP